MKRRYKAISAFLLGLLLVCTLGVTAFADSASVRYEGGAEKFVFIPGDDLFPNLKNVMPGDRLTQTITVQNSNKGSEYVNLYLRAEAHHDATNPLSQKVAAAGESVASMSDFLDQLRMTVKVKDTVIYQASPEALGGLKNNVLLGALKQGETADLTVELAVPLELGSKYANRTGEVDWVFVAEEMNNESPSVTPIPGGTSAGGSSPKTGDSSPIEALRVVMVLGAFAFVAVLAGKKKEKS